MSVRIDKELVERKLATSRSKAQELISRGFVVVSGKVVQKESQKVSETDEIIVLENDTMKYVSRGGLKLEKAINSNKLNLNNKNIMDIGSSTGGFTDCSLRHGAKTVTAIDVGSNLMHETLRNHPQVKLYENTNIKSLDSSFFENIDMITVDVSFISIKQIVDKIASEDKEFDLICLIKPQFECGKQIAKKFKGVILDEKIHKNILEDTIKYFNDKNFTLENIDVSPIKGGDGNIEYVSYFTNKTDFKTNKKTKNQIDKLVSLAFS
ncbi:MAG: TlyA family RNA methyltransferase [Clostridia bacterium]